jgi:hypothetical protein
MRTPRFDRFPAVIALVAGAALGAPADAAPAAPAPGSALPGEGFALLGEEKGIKIYRRDKRPGIELAGEGAIAGPPERARRVLLDYAGHPRWNKHLKESRIVARGADFVDVYQRLGLPILDDRDYTLHVTWGDEGGVFWLRFVTANERGPAPVQGVVRVTQHTGSWRLDPDAGGAATRAVYRFHLDLAGSFPSWMGKGQAQGDVAALFGDVGKQIPRYP